jgi:hypothetical protein
MGIMWLSLLKIQYTELKLLCGNDRFVKISIYSNGDLELWPNDPKINRVLPLPQGNHVAKFGKNLIYRTKVIVRKPVWTPAIPNHIIRPISRRVYKNERIWSYVKETTSHLQYKLTKNIHLGVATRSSTKWDCLKPIRLHQYTWGLQHCVTFLQEDIGHIKCYWFKINYLFWSSFYIGKFCYFYFFL